HRRAWTASGRPPPRRYRGGWAGARPAPPGPARSGANPRPAAPAAAPGACATASRPGPGGAGGTARSVAGTSQACHRLPPLTSNQPPVQHHRTQEDKQDGPGNAAIFQPQGGLVQPVAPLPALAGRQVRLVTVERPHPEGVGLLSALDLPHADLVGPDV